MATAIKTTGIIGIDNIRPAMIRAKKIQLHTGLEGFESPDSYGIYRHTGGKALGVTGRVFEPPDLDLFLMSIVHSVDKCADWLPLDRIEYKELNGGSKVRISIPGPDFNVDSKKVAGITFKTRLDFNTGFDGLTKTSLSSFSLNGWCDNGAKLWGQDVGLSFKNTPGNQGKWVIFCDEILQVLGDLPRYQAFLQRTTTIDVNTAKVNAFFKELLGYGLDEYKELTVRKRNILDRINESVAREMNDHGSSVFALIQGVTRYTTHHLAEGDPDALLLNTPEKLTRQAHSLAAAMLS
jgi:hypothetical protein